MSGGNIFSYPTGKTGVAMFRSKISCRMICAIIAAALSGPVVAATLQRPGELEQQGDPQHPDTNDNVYTFSGKDMKTYGAEVNASPLRLQALFGTIPDTDAKRAQPDATEKNGWLGIAMQPPAKPPKDPDTGLDLNAIEVASVMPGSAAAAAGLLKGDLLIGLDGKPLGSKGGNTPLFFRFAILGKHSGEKTKLRVMRGKDILELDATIKSYPKVKAILKTYPDLDKARTENKKSLLADLLKKGKLTDQFANLLKVIRNETDKAVSVVVRQGDYSNFNSKVKQGGDERTTQTVQIARQGVSEKANAVSPMKWNGNYNPFRLQEVNYLMYHPLELPIVAREKITDRLHGALDKSHHDLAGLVRTTMDELDMKYAPAQPKESKPPADFTDYLERLVNAIQHANTERTAVLSVLNTGEIDFLYATASGLLEEKLPDMKQEKTPQDEKKIDEENEAELLRFIHLTLKLDLPRLLNASAEVAQAIDLNTLETLDSKAGKLQRYPAGWVVHEKENLTVIDTPAGRVLIGGAKDNIYMEDAALILDFGGNDKYFNHAGGSTRLDPFSVVIDLSGDDVYSTTDDFAQGSGLVGGGFLVDLKGDDLYAARNYSQGSGFFGIGILADLAGRDQYSAIAASQGAGAFGAGILAEGGGNDSYFGNRFVQGFGYIRGFGAIVEATGNDDYIAGDRYEDFRAPGKSYQSMSQGFGFGIRPSKTPVGASGGIGVIAEAEGNDTYVADYFSQGSSYWFALGILDDRKGNDRYIAGRYSQGAGIHSSLGVLIDGEGDDNYLADFGVSQGCGHDFGTGFLLDNGGNDRYIAGVIAQGAGNDNGIGILSDNGGNDEYYLHSIGQGRGNFEPISNMGSFGLLFDTGGGNDVYTRGGKNNSLMYKTHWGILLDSN
jgi:PDZ domain